MNKEYTVTLIEDELTGETFLPFPDEILEHLNLKEGDIVNFQIDGSRISISKAPQ